MITTLLFDLDNTLLGNDLGTFLPAYFGQIVRYLPAAPGGDVIRELINATRATIANTDPSRVLFDVFAECFSQGTGWPKDDWWPRVQRFYAEAYRDLRALVTPLPAARKVVEWALEAGYEVGITTNPLFPQAAIRERLRWAGLDDLPFALISDIEHLHFAKPHPQFYAEVLAELGRRPEQALVVGDNWESDIGAASAAGLATYWIVSHDASVEAGLAGEGSKPALPLLPARPIGSGTLDDFLAWAPAALGVRPMGARAWGAAPGGQQAETDTAHPAPPPGPALPYLLAGSLAVFSGRLAGLSDAEWKMHPGPGEWSLTEVICHLRDVELEVNLPRVRAVVDEDNPFVAGADTDPWAGERNYQAQSGPDALRDFLQTRQQAAHFLRRQPIAVWSRTARHAIFGPTQLVEIVGWVLDHDRIHLEQVRKTVQSVRA